MITAINVNGDWTVGDLIDFEFPLALQNGPCGPTRPAPIETGGHLLASNGWKIERERVIVGHGGVALSLPRKKDASTMNQ